jgi:hypothetical protein
MAHSECKPSSAGPEKTRPASRPTNLLGLPVFPVAPYPISPLPLLPSPSPRGGRARGKTASLPSPRRRRRCRPRRRPSSPARIRGSSGARPCLKPPLSRPSLPLPLLAGGADTVSWLFVEFSIGRWGPDGIALVRGGIVALPPRLRGPRCSVSLAIGGGAGASEDRGFSYGRRPSALTSLV